MHRISSNKLICFPSIYCPKLGPAQIMDLREILALASLDRPGTSTALTLSSSRHLPSLCW